MENNEEEKKVKEKKIEIVKTKKENKKRLPKDVSQEIMKRVVKNLVIAIAIMAYFFVLNMACAKMKEERLINDLKVFAGTFLVVAIIMLEKAYKNSDGTKGIYGIELLIMSAHTLSIMHVITLYKYNFQLYLLASSNIFAIYYVLKSIIIYTKGRKQYLESLSDISEIIKDEPQKKDAKKQKATEENKKEIKKTKEIKTKEINTKEINTKKIEVKKNENKKKKEEK